MTAYGVPRLPFLGPHQPWQILFLLGSVIGLATAALTLTIREPNRLSTSKPDMSAAFSHFCEYPRLYIALLSAFSASSFVSYVLASWTVSFYVRTYGVSVASASAVIGACSLVIGPLSSVTGGWVTDNLQKTALKFPPLLIVGSCIASFPLFTLGLWLAPTMPLSLVAYACLYFSIGMTIAPCYGGVQALTPAKFRGLFSSIFVSIYTLIGGGLGPYLVGLLSAAYFKSDKMLGPSIMVTTTGAAVFGLAAIILAMTAKPWSSRHA